MNMTYFNAEKTRDNLVQWIRDWFEKNGPTSKAVIGISGGKDSTIVAALCARALGTDRVLGVLMPNGTQADIQDSYRVCEKLGIASIIVNIQDAYAGVYGSVLKALDYPALSEQTTINIAPRLRMTTLYAVSQTVGGRVINTSNLSEFLTGYFTRWGDECGDMKPLINLTKNEVVAIGLTMDEIPRDLVEKAPSDGLTGKTDEDKIGFKYDDLDKWIRSDYLPNGEADMREDVYNKILARIDMVAFKCRGPDQFLPGFKDNNTPTREQIIKKEHCARPCTMDKERAAISAPRRQCDVGTADEQMRRYCKFTDRYNPCSYKGNERCAKDCPIHKKLTREGHGELLCQLEWSQMPYTEEKGGAE